MDKMAESSAIPPSTIPDEGSAIPSATAESSSMPPWGQVKYYHPTSGSASAVRPPLPATDPEPTPAELKSTFLSSSRPPIGPDAPLLTSAARAKLYPPKPRKTYTSVRLRLRFPDRSLLEATLAITATIADVFDLLRANLEPEVQRADAVLWQTVPRMEWKDVEKDRRVKLDTLGWAPNALVNVRFTDERVASRKTWVSEQLRKEAGPVPVASWEEGGGSGGGSTLGGSTSGDAAKREEGKKPMPKWLKGIVKK